MKHLMVCRSAFCVRCWQAERPIKGNRFLVFGTTHQNFKSKLVHNGGVKGFTPHLYMIEWPYKLTEEGLVVTTKTCMMDGCGITIGNLKKDGTLEMTILKVETVQLSEISLGALITLWRGNTGYNLI